MPALAILADKVEFVDQGLLGEFFAECGFSDPFRIVVTLKGESAPQVHEFHQPFLVVGRRSASDLFLDHWLVSRRHAYLQLIEGRFFCVDLGSRTGTHGGDATERAGWVDPVRAIQIGPYLVRPELPPCPDRDYPPLPIVTWTISNQSESINQWTMNRGLALVGRSPACRVRISAPDVSRFHCGLVLTPRGVWVVDLLSQRPILLNGSAVRFSRVSPGDVLQVGHHTLTPHYDFSLIHAAAERPGSAFVVAESPVEVPTRGNTKTQDLLPALIPDIESPIKAWSSANPSFVLTQNDDFRSADPTVSNLVQQFGLMQQQMFDQFHQTMMMMFEGFASLHRETSATIRQEFDEVRKLSDEIVTLRAETARLTEVTTLSIQEPAFQKSSHHQGQPRNGRPDHPEPSPSPLPPPKVVPPLPDPHVDIHAQLCQRLNSIENERQTRWQKILAMMTTKA